MLWPHTKTLTFEKCDLLVEMQKQASEHKVNAATNFVCYITAPHLLKQL